MQHMQQQHMQHTLQRGQQGPWVAPPAPGGRPWEHPPFALMLHSQLQEEPVLTSEPYAAADAAVCRLRLRVGMSHPLCKERDLQPRYRHIYTALVQREQQQEESSDIMELVCNHRTCSLKEENTRDGFMEITLHPSAAAMAAAQQLVQDGSLQVGAYKVPVQWAAAAHPAGAVELLFMNPPSQFARKGFTSTVLAAAGYSASECKVLHEQLGYSRIMGNAAARIPCADAIIAYVEAPEDDLILRHLPDSFVVLDRLAGGSASTTSIFVQGRTAQQPHKWTAEQEQQQRVRQKGRALLQERILLKQQMTQQQQQNQQQLQALWRQSQNRQQQQSQPQQRQQQEAADVEMEEAYQPQQQQVGPDAPTGDMAAAAAAAIAAAFAGLRGSSTAAAAAAATLPFDPFAQEQVAAAAAAAGAYANWRQGQHAEQLCIRAEELRHGAEMPWDSSMQEQMLQAFFAQYSASNQDTAAADEQWLGGYLGVPDACYEDCLDDDQDAAAAAQAGSSSMLEPQQQQQQQEQQELRRPPADACRAAGSGVGKGGKGAVGAATATSTAPVRRSGRQRLSKNPVFAADVNQFAELVSQDQQQKQQQKQQKQQQQPQQVIPLTPQQADRPRPGRNKQ
jgi:hypothetical protein